MKILKYTKYTEAMSHWHCLLQIQQFYASLNMTNIRQDSCNVLEVHYKLRPVVVTNYGKFITNHDQMCYL